MTVDLVEMSRERVPGRRVGVAALTRAAYAGADPGPLAQALRETLLRDPGDAAALMDLSVVEQMRGNLQQGLTMQALALHRAQVYGTAGLESGTVRLLVLAAPLAMGANTPVDFLLRGASVSLQTLYVAPGIPLPDPLPEHDIAFVAAPGDSDASRVFLRGIADILPGWPRPVLNAPEAIMRLERDRSGAALSGVPGLRLPRTARTNRAILGAVGRGELELRDAMYEGRYPLVARPVGAHAGRGLARLDTAADIGPYLDTCADDEFFLSDFVDYRSADGLYRKYRLVFVGGRPHPCHMAISDGWKVWYMNADMAGSAAKRAEEAAFMEGFETGFARHHAAALSGMARAFGLDYFGIDCAEDRDGNLVLFEADNALIVHDMDDPDTFPYKPARMRAIFDAFAGMVARRARPMPTPLAQRRAG